MEALVYSLVGFRPADGAEAVSSIVRRERRVGVGEPLVHVATETCSGHQ